MLCIIICAGNAAFEFVDSIEPPTSSLQDRNTLHSARLHCLPGSVYALPTFWLAWDGSTEQTQSRSFCDHNQLSIGLPYMRLP